MIGFCEFETIIWSPLYIFFLTMARYYVAAATYNVAAARKLFGNR